MSGRTSGLINATSATERNVTYRCCCLLSVSTKTGALHVLCLKLNGELHFFGSGHTYRKIAPWQALVAQRCNLSRETLLFG